MRVANKNMLMPNSHRPKQRPDIINNFKKGKKMAEKNEVCKIVTAEGFACPYCNKVWQEDLEQLCFEPFNGIVITCNCKKKFSITMLMKIEEI